VSVLRAARPPQIVDVDEGWRHDRDLSLAIGRWGWIHLKTLVEEHEQGACLFRVRARLRPSIVGTLRGATLAVLVAGSTSASMFLYDRAFTLVVAAVGVAAIGLWTALQAIRGAAVLDRAIGRVVTNAGMVELPLSPHVSPTLVREPSGSSEAPTRGEPVHPTSMDATAERRRRHAADASAAGARAEE
jgi:hypothetical protein